MNFSISIRGWSARAPGLGTNEDWMSAAQNTSPAFNPQNPLAKLKNLSTTMARRLNSGSRLALDSALDIFSSHQPDAFIFTCQHGELERNFRILSSLSEGSGVSPTDFTLSVHNSAVGQLAIMLNSPTISTSIAAGEDSFHQGLIEAVALLNNGFERILLVDFEGQIPDFYAPYVGNQWPYACAMIIEKGHDLHCKMMPSSDFRRQSSALPQSIQFLLYWLSQRQRLVINSQHTHWSWSR